jgi:hypothetical protein
MFLAASGSRGWPEAQALNPMAVIGIKMINLKMAAIINLLMCIGQNYTRPAH